MKVIEQFKQNVFYPLKDKPDILSSKKGLYLICIKNLDELPKTMRNLTIQLFEGNFVIYLGIAGNRGLRKRDYKNHFHGTARNSTLRKSLGVLFEYEKLQKENEKGSNKYRFIPAHEQQLTEWMVNNLFMYYCVTDEDVEGIETELIKYFNPPLNLSKNRNEGNQDFRKHLTKLRCTV